MTCTQRSLNILEAMIKKMEAGQRIEIADVKMILTLLTTVSQHAEEQAAIARIEEAVRIRKGLDFVRNCRELSRLLKNGFNQERDVFGGLAPEVSTNFYRLERKYVPQLKEKTIIHARA
jgi:hypothetical protein